MSSNAIQERITVIDSHTGGEPTRVVIDGGPELGRGAISERRQILKERFDHFRSAVVNEPRGSDVMVGALLCEPCDSTCATGVIFFNNTGYLGMCGHGTIGLIATLSYLDEIVPGEHRIETPVGTVTARLQEDGSVLVRNVPSYRHRKDVTVEVANHGPVTGDVAWGGNWFFLVCDSFDDLSLANVEQLTGLCHRIRHALSLNGVTGADDAEIDHIELFGAPRSAAADSRNFVLCPGGAYDRSSCGTGTSAKLACLAADGRLVPGDVWRQESIVGSILEASFVKDGDAIIPSFAGTAFITSEATLVLHPSDPFRTGIRS
ncbi:MAG: proline racemase family protein [Planctomycetota bacterium]|nr:proline racemase family protein [Planctomycetota bacterium]MDA1141987.1 proline racemase family protein [Planctomycetota bacterium]